MTVNQKKDKNDFEQIDVRKLTVNFLPGLLARAAKVEVGDGMCVIQSFEPIPLYSAMKDLGFEHETEKIADDEYRVYFTRIEGKDAAFAVAGNMPLKPTAVLNFKKIDNALADTVVSFWNQVWGNEQSVIDPRIKLLLSLSNGVGAGRFRQATRELVKAYALGVTVAELDELFSLFVWNAGVGNFASEIGPSSLFGAYQLIKTMEEKGSSREQVMEALLETYGENNPDVNVLPRSGNNK